MPMLEGQVGELEVALERVADAPGHRPDGLEVGSIGDEHREFVASQPGDRVDGPQDFAEPVADLPEQ